MDTIPTVLGVSDNSELLIGLKALTARREFAYAVECAFFMLGYSVFRITTVPHTEYKHWNSDFIDPSVKNYINTLQWFSLLVIEVLAACLVVAFFVFGIYVMWIAQIDRVEKLTAERQQAQEAGQEVRLRAEAKRLETLRLADLAILRAQTQDQVDIKSSVMFNSRSDQARNNRLQGHERLNEWLKNVELPGLGMRSFPTKRESQIWLQKREAQKTAGKRLAMPERNTENPVSSERRSGLATVATFLQQKELERRRIHEEVIRKIAEDSATKDRKQHTSRYNGIFGGHNQGKSRSEWKSIFPSLSRYSPPPKPSPPPQPLPLEPRQPINKPPNLSISIFEPLLGSPTQPFLPHTILSPARPQQSWTEVQGHSSNIQSSGNNPDVPSGRPLPAFTMSGALPPLQTPSGTHTSSQGHVSCGLTPLLGSIDHSTNPVPVTMPSSRNQSCGLTPYLGTIHHGHSPCHGEQLQGGLGETRKQKQNHGHCLPPPAASGSDQQHQSCGLTPYLGSLGAAHAHHYSQPQTQPAQWPASGTSIFSGANWGSFLAAPGASSSEGIDKDGDVIMEDTSSLKQPNAFSHVNEFKATVLQGSSTEWTQQSALPTPSWGFSNWSSSQAVANSNWANVQISQQQQQQQQQLLAQQQEELAQHQQLEVQERTEKQLFQQQHIQRGFPQPGQWLAQTSNSYAPFKELGNNSGFNPVGCLETNVPSGIDSSTSSSDSALSPIAMSIDSQEVQYLHGGFSTPKKKDFDAAMEIESCSSTDSTYSHLITPTPAAVSAFAGAVTFARIAETPIECAGVSADVTGLTHITGSGAGFKRLPTIEEVANEEGKTRVDQPRTPTGQASFRPRQCLGSPSSKSMFQVGANMKNSTDSCSSISSSGFTQFYSGGDNSESSWNQGSNWPSPDPVPVTKKPKRLNTFQIVTTPLPASSGSFESTGTTGSISSGSSSILDLSEFVSNRLNGLAADQAKKKLTEEELLFSVSGLQYSTGRGILLPPPK
ncbi:hypothetical protein BDZ91DRAFT_796608 [Kalaharituber pfeilii]|nr:hypothetical protein BDZ91DRAFT_796608 [Kalaharituber pfeilii]